MKALLVEPSGRGSIVQYTYRLACALSRRVEQVILLTAADSDLLRLPSSPPPRVVLLAHLTPAAPEVKFLRSSAARKAAALLGRIADVARLLATCRRHRPDIVHLQAARSPDALLLAALRAARLPVVCTLHNLSTAALAPHHRAARWILCRLPDLVLAHADGNRRSLHRAMPARHARLTIMPPPQPDSQARTTHASIGTASWLSIARRTAAAYAEVLSARVCTNW